MNAIKRFEDIESWQRARLLTKAIYQITSNGAFSRDLRLCDQIRAASVSIMSNIAEGFGRGGNKEFRQFLGIAGASVCEVQSQLYVALDAGFLSQDQFQTLYDQAATCGRLIGGLMRYLANSELTGHKFQGPRTKSQEP
jgi:four helix bundle protein